MSGIYGIFNLDKKPASKTDLLKMCEPMRYWGPDGSNIWREGPVGFGHLMLFNSPESVSDIMPKQRSKNGFVITAHCRLDNRKELFTQLNIPVTEQANIPDSDLLLSAYEKWSENCVHHLLGDWVFAIWNPHQGELFIARDQHGISGLFYYQNSHFFAFSTSLTGLLASDAIPKKPNAFRIAQDLVGWNEHGPMTSYQDIFRLPPSHYIKIVASKTEIKRYCYLENVSQIYYKNDDDYIEAFLDVYKSAVECRLRSYRQIGITLSGGLDSGSVAALAARELQKRNQRLQAFSSVPLYDASSAVNEMCFWDESPFVQATANFVGNIDVHLIKAENTSPLEGIKLNLDCHQETQRFAGQDYWINSMLSAAQKKNIGTLLTGQDGNATISWRGVYERKTFSNYLANREFRKAIKHLLYSTVLKPWKMINSDKKKLIDKWKNFSPINVKLANELDLENRLGAYQKTIDSYEKEKLVGRFEQLKPGRSKLGSTWFENGAYYGMDVRDPTSDKRVIEFCFAIPHEQFRKEGTDRYLIRRAMQGLLPPEVLWNRKRGRQAADIGHRILHYSNELDATLSTIENSDLAHDFLDLPLMRNVFKNLQEKMEPQTVVQAQMILLKGIKVGLFLQKFENNKVVESNN